MFIRQLAIIGVGLIGGSLARALRQAGHCQRIIGCGRGEDNLRQARELGVIDAYTQDPAEAAREADLVVIAVPLGGMAEIFRLINPALPADALITDVGSAKLSVITAAREMLSREVLPRFVPAHPLAGAEKTGVAASSAELFRQRRVVLTPLPENDETSLDKMTEMWRVTGAKVSRMDPWQHDRILAATSHLPHVLAYTLVDRLLTLESREGEIFAYAASGFRDFSRIASSDPRMWRDICLANREAILEMLEDYEKSLRNFRFALERGDGESLQALFQRAKQARDDFYL